ncbi:MAG: GNAT family N-acetyltransferase [Ferruginibacter sp.]
MIELRPEAKKDYAFIEAVYRSTREAELNLTNWTEQQKNAFVLMQSMAQLSEYKTKFPGAVLQVIIFNKKNAGRFYTWENDTEIRLIDITLLPKFRGKGIGTAVLQDLVKRSDKIQKKISLHVDPAIPALQLYVRLGFMHIKNNGRHYYMERSPAWKPGNR